MKPIKYKGFTIELDPVMYKVYTAANMDNYNGEACLVANSLDDIKLEIDEFLEDMK